MKDKLRLLVNKNKDVKQQCNSLEELAAFLREFVRKNTTSAEKAKMIRDNIKGHRPVLIVDHVNKRVTVGRIDNVVYMPKKDHDD